MGRNCYYNFGVSEFIVDSRYDTLTNSGIVSAFADPLSQAMGLPKFQMVFTNIASLDAVLEAMLVLRQRMEREEKAKHDEQHRTDPETPQLHG